MKKLLALTLSAILVLSLAACGKDDDSSKAAETTTAATTTEATTVESSEEEPEEATFPELTADANSITFDAGTDISFVDAMKEYEEKEDSNESKIELSIAELEGESMLKVDIEDITKIPKIVFDIKKIIAEENIEKINYIKVDIFSKAIDTVETEDGEEVLIPNWQGGAAAVDSTTQGWKNQTDIEFSGYDTEWGYSQTTQLEILPTGDNKLVGSDEKVWFVIQKWVSENKVDMYIDNLTFVDFDGNTIPTLIG